jgi:putative hydrolase of the HAD superfamily
MVLVFDLDDTLYEEMTYVISGFNAVAKYGEDELGLDARHSFDWMITYVTAHGRGKVFDGWLTRNQAFTRKRLLECVRVYRHHMPNIYMLPSVSKLLEELKLTSPLYLVTDGHKIAQHKKIQALGLERLFKRIFITHRFGLKHSKPSIYCFDIIRKAEGVQWHDIVYVGDNPAKDFVNLNSVGAKTVRVRTGAHARVVATSAYDAGLTIDTLLDLPDVIT